MGWRKFAGALAVLCTVTGCTSTVTGLPSAVPGAKAVAPPRDPNDPCGLLTPEQLAGMELLPEGRLHPAEPQRTMPAYCAWETDKAHQGTSSSMASLTVMYSTAIPIEDYHNSKAPIEQIQAGGFTWGRYESLLGPGSCDLAVKLGGTSFVEVSSENDTDFSKACDRAKLALPQVAAHLPGGQPAPPPTPKPKPPPSPLAALEPCDLLTAAEFGQMHLAGAGRKLGKGRDPRDVAGMPPGCAWDPVDENVNGLFTLYLYDKSAAEINATTGEKPDEQVKVGDRTWDLNLSPGGGRSKCEAILPFGENAAVKVNSANWSDPGKACEQIRTAIPLVTPRLPAG